MQSGMQKWRRGHNQEKQQMRCYYEMHETSNKHQARGLHSISKLQGPWARLGCKKPANIAKRVEQVKWSLRGCRNGTQTRKHATVRDWQLFSGSIGRLTTHRSACGLPVLACASRQGQPSLGARVGIPWVTGPFLKTESGQTSIISVSVAWSHAAIPSICFHQAAICARVRRIRSRIHISKHPIQRYDEATEERQTTMASAFEPSLSTSRPPLGGPSLADTLPTVNFGFDELRDRMAKFTAKFDAFIEQGRKRVLEERNQFRMNVAELQGEKKNDSSPASDASVD